MRKKLTMLLMLLLAFVGVAKADFTQKWEKTTVWQTEGFTAPTEVTALAESKSFSVAMMETPVNVTSTTIGVTFTWGKIGNCALQVLGVDLVSEDGDVLIKGSYSHQAAGGGGAKTYSLTDLTENIVGKLRYFVGYGSSDRLNDTGGDITITGAERNGFVSLVINYTYDEREISTVSVKAAPGENYTIPALTYTKIASCKIGDTDQTVTDGTCVITVPAEGATITVALADNLPFAVSEDFDDAVWYLLKIRGNQNVVNNGGSISSKAPLTASEGALWAFMGNPFDGIQVLNKAAGDGYTLTLDGTAKMKEETTTWELLPNGDGFILRVGNSANNCVNDVNGTLSTWNHANSLTDPGSTFVVVSEAEMISQATTALNSLKSSMTTYEEASYYTYSDEVLAAAKAALQGLDATNLLTALQTEVTVESVQATLNAAAKGTTAPVAGDVIQLKNRSYGKYLKANDADLTSVVDKNDLATLWVVEGGTDGNVKLKNYSTNEYIGEIRQSTTVAMVESANAKQFAFTNQTDVYAVFKETTGGGYAYGHIAGHNVLVGWEPGANATQWLVSNVCPLSITYLYNDVELGTTTTVVEKGVVYTVSSPYDFTKPGACKKGEETLEAVDGVFSFEVTEATTLTVELADDLPFTMTVLNQDGSFPENTAWYVVKQHSTAGYGQAWKYDETNGVTTESTTTYTDNHLWCFAGNKDDLKIYNKVAGKGFSLTNTDPASMAAENAAVWKVVKSAAEASFAGKNPFCLQKGNENLYLNRQGNKLKYWGSKDQGSTIMVISQSAIELAALVNRLNGIITTLEDNVGKGIGYYESAEAVAELMESIGRAQTMLDSNSGKAEDYVAAIAELNEAEAKATKIELPESGKYYRIGYDYGSEVGIKYMQSVSSSVKGLNMTSDSDVMSVVFYYADGKLQSLDTKGYLKEDGNTRGLQANANNAGTITFSAGSVLGKIKIQAPSYLHANQNNDNYFIDHCGSDGGHAQHNFVIEEITTEELNEIIFDAGSTFVTDLPTENSNHPLTIAPNTSAWAVNNDGTALTSIARLGLAADVLDTKQQFAIITVEGSSYLYSIHAKRFIKKNNTFGAQGDPIQLNDASSVDLENKEYRRQFQFVDENLYFNVDGYNNMAINWWGTVDRGNACLIVSYDQLTFDLDEALDIFQNGADITLTYKLGDKQVSTTTYKKKGDTYSFNNPYAFTTVTSCKKDGEDLEATEGTYSFEVTGDANIVVELQDNLPFRYAGSYDKIEHWYFMKIRDDGFTYLGYDAEKAYIRANQSSVSADAKDAYTWGFVGNPFDGFSIVNYATGKTKVLSAPIAPNTEKNADQLARMVEVVNEYTGNLVWNIKAPTHANPKPGVFYIEHPTANSYAFNRQGYDGANALCYWTGRDTGSAIQVEERGVFNLSDLGNVNVYTLQAERSPLMYSATEGMTTKLSSGLVDGVSADASDINQQFLILRTSNTPEGQYYLYSIGAGKFVDENLNFVDFPYPVLSFEAYNGTNSVVYPWWVKVGDKYVIPSDYGTDGNKIYHVPGGDDDEGKRYRIVNAGKSNDNSVLSKIEEAEEMIKTISELSNEKVYTVSTYDRGSWYYNSEKEALWSTGKAGVEFSSSDATQQFAFLTVAGQTYLYSIGAQKFVVMSEANEKGQTFTAYSNEPSQTIEFLTASGSKFYPFVVALVNGDNKHHIGVSNSYDPPVITFYNDLNDGGNKIKIREVESEHMSDGTVELLAAAVNKIDAYLAAQEFKPELAELIAEAEALLAKNYLDAEDATSLTNAKTAAQAVFDAETSGSAALTEQIELLTEAIATAAYVRDVNEFKNSYVYTFVTLRGWVGADENSENLIGTVNSKVDPAPTPSDDNAMFQWAVYKSSNEHYYLYNIGKQKFMGMPNGEVVPFVDVPQSKDLTFKRHNNGNAKWADYPIMLSPDNKGAVSQNANAGLFYWSGGWNTTNDDGNNHKVTAVGRVSDDALSAIAEAVELYELKLELGECLNTFRSNYYDGWAPTADKWRDQPGVNNYSLPNGSKRLEEYYNEVNEFYQAIDNNVSADDIEAKITYLENIGNSLTINQPEAGKFYRLRCVDGQKYLQSTVNSTNNRLTLTGDKGAAAMFCYHEGALLSYTTGLYMDHRVFNEVGVKSTVTFSEAVNGSRGCYIIKVGSDYHIYGAGSNLDSGSGTPDNRNGYNWWLEEVTELPISITAAGYTTLYAPVALEISEEVEAYVATEVETESVFLTKVTGVVPAETALIIKGEEGDYAFGIRTAEDVTAVIATNALKGTVAKSLITPADDYTCYVLAKKDDKVGLYKATLNKNDNTAFLNNACKVYLPVANPPVGQAARALAFRFGRDNEGTTDLEKSEIRNEKSEMIFDLTGRRIEKIVEKGMYIVNGKKVIFR